MLLTEIIDFMKPEFKIKRTIIARYLDAIEEYDQKDEKVNLSKYDLSTDEGVQEAYDHIWEIDSRIQDFEYEFREGEERTSLECDWSRNYESEAVASKMFDGTYCGWTYWFGGGKHSNPEEIEWMEDAYDLNFVEEEKLVTIKTFSKINE